MRGVVALQPDRAAVRNYFGFVLWYAEHLDQAVVQFEKAMDLRLEDDWKRLDEEFADFYATLLDMDTRKFAPPPPALADWPGYVPAEPIDPRRR